MVIGALMNAQHPCSSHLDSPNRHTATLQAMQWSPRVAVFRMIQCGIFQG